MLKKILLFLLSSFFASTTYSNEVVTILGYGPGGLDTTIRRMAADAEKHTNFRFLIINRPGANGVIALKQYFAGAEQNSAVLGVSGGQILFEPMVRPENNWLDQIRIIGPVITSPLAVATSSASKITDIRFLFDKNQPRKKINIGTAGESHEMLVKLIAAHSHHDIQSVRFKGSDGAYISLMGGHIDLAVSVYGDLRGKSDTVKIIGVAQQQGVDDVPSLQRWVPDAEIVNFFAFALSNSQTNYHNLSAVLTRGLVANQRVEFLKPLGYQVDMNPKNDYMERKIIPLFKKWSKSHKAQ